MRATVRGPSVLQVTAFPRERRKSEGRGRKTDLRRSAVSLLRVGPFPWPLGLSGSPAGSPPAHPSLLLSSRRPRPAGLCTCN